MQRKHGRDIKRRFAKKRITDGGNARQRDDAGPVERPRDAQRHCGGTVVAREQVNEVKEISLGLAPELLGDPEAMGLAARIIKRERERHDVGEDILDQ